MRDIIRFLVIIFIAVMILREGCNCAIDIFNKVNTQPTSAGTSSTETHEANGEGNYSSPSSESQVIESTIESDFDGFDSDNIFKLSNGQVWQQDEYKYKYSYKYRPKVTIVKSDYSYKMLVDGIDEAVKVKLIAGNLDGSRSTSTSNYTSPKFEAYVTSDFNGFGSGKIFKLDNGQVWEQTEGYSYSYSYSRPKVTIEKVGGSYKLKFDNIDHAVTVKRID